MTRHMEPCEGVASSVLLIVLLRATMIKTGVFPMASFHITLQLRVVDPARVNPCRALGATERHVAPLSVGHCVRRHHVDVAVDRCALCLVNR